MPRRSLAAGEPIAAEAPPALPETTQDAPEEPARALEWHVCHSALENPTGGFWQPGDAIPPGALFAESARILIERAIIAPMDAPPPPADDTPQE